MSSSSALQPPPHLPSIMITLCLLACLHACLYVSLPACCLPPHFARLLITLTTLRFSNDSHIMPLSCYTSFPPTCLSICLPTLNQPALCLSYTNGLPCLSHTLPLLALVYPGFVLTSHSPEPRSPLSLHISSVCPSHRRLVLHTFPIHQPCPSHSLLSLPPVLFFTYL